ncbi:hexose kinase [Virgibacillus salexigens]|uniref:Tagatose-6-phosphate kinase n=1 Tax=Virgibacillus massiliensis TaxID=1462526 RepID=A0A024Q7K3_9BACI|nr:MULTISPECIES: hexose kinase [Virgibacillus]MYL40756.1 hexose kinase [Virgibacillus massiliensis]CDQ38449.1 Tagatose-6-phosphate kinase [Virgibacillus massiliensis]
MILTVTLNPSVDMQYQLSALQVNDVNRAAHVSKTAGGKGLNVTRVIDQLQEQVTATGFLGGRLGEFIVDELSQQQIAHDFVSIQGETRNCIAVLHDGKQTEILENGPIITKDESEQFLQKLQNLLGKVTRLTISGSLPKGLTVSFYQQIISLANQQKVPVFLDTKASLLMEIVKGDAKPYLIKPNQQEFAEAMEMTSNSVEAIVDILSHRTLLSDIPWVVVTLGKDGAVIKHEAVIYRASIPNIHAKNPVGSGDSVLAGFAVGHQRQLSAVELIQFGLTMGVLNALQAQTGQIDPEAIPDYLSQIHVRKLLK